MNDKVEQQKPQKGRLNELVEALELYRELGVEYLIIGKDKRAGDVYCRMKKEIEKTAQQTETEPESAMPQQGQQDTPSAVSPSDTRRACKAKPLTLLDLAEKKSLEKIDDSEKGSLLDELSSELGNCTRCKLCHTRKNIVFGEGNPAARLMFVGEGPGATEDETGRPFVGRAGKLLDKMIAAMGLKREDVYIANIVKCRPPGNRDPEPDEVKSCTPFLIRQIEIIQPDVIISLGAPASKFLFGQKSPMSILRGAVSMFRGARLIATYHPAFLLRSPGYKKEAWEDLKKAMALLGLKPPAKK